MSIEAKVHAPTASFAERALVYGAVAVLFALGLLTANTFPFAYKLLGSALTIWLVSPLLLRRPRGAQAHVDCEGGRIIVRPDRMAPRTIETRRLAGASVARNGSGAVVTLSEIGTRNPIAIEVATPDAANELRAALGIPHGGFGEITWCLEPRSVDVTVALTRVMAAAAMILAIPALVLGSSLSGALATFGGAVSLVTLMAVFARGLTNDHTLRLRASEIQVTTNVTERIALSEIEELAHDDTALVIREKDAKAGMVVRCAPTRLDSGMNAEERALMIAQLRGALAASKGEIAPFVDPTSHLDALKRNEASPADWLARLDALASQHANDAYRSTTIAKEDLWRALESHDAGAEVRAGAARVLLRISPEKEQDRIARAIDSVHDDDERAHIRAALKEDPEEAAAELEATAPRLDTSRR